MNKHKEPVYSFNSHHSKNTPVKHTDWISRINKFMAWSFYALFFSVPLVMYPTTYELFEFNKMWVTFGIALIVLFLWVSKIILSQRLLIKRTPLDIPILLFLLSQFISTIFSMDPHVSWWGYYSRFNGGFLSTLTYVFLYYAFVSNLTHTDENKKPFSYKLLVITLISGAVVALWGFPSHFKLDPTCLVFRGTLDISCWTEAFAPHARMFSTLGQPNWMAAYLAVLTPLAVAFSLFYLSHKKENKNFLWYGITWIAFSALFYIDLIWTDSRSGFFAFWVGQAAAVVLFCFTTLRSTQISKAFKNNIFVTFVGINALFVLIAFLVGTPIDRLDPYTLQGLTQKAQVTPPPPSEPSAATPQAPQQQQESTPTQSFSGTDSGDIRNIVWQGALEIFKKNPLFGSGVETFAYAYYQVRPAEHNLTSEWDYLYNKAHNEYLTYLATTGIFGLGTYLVFIGMFLFIAFSVILKSKADNKFLFIGISLVGGFISILVSNYFGFSVVIVNLFLFLIPLFFLDLLSPNSFKIFSLRFSDASQPDTPPTITPMKATTIAVVAIVVLYFEFLLYYFWLADQSYALGYNLNKVGQYIQATQPLSDAVAKRPGERLFKDELSLNLSTIALLMAQQNQATQAAGVITQAKQLSDEVVQQHPNNVVYFKTRTRVLYSLAQLDASFMPEAIGAIERAHMLAPTDAKISYNLALLYDQPTDHSRAIQVLRETIKLKPNYADAHYALALFYSQMSKEEKNPQKAAEYKKEAQDVLNNFLSMDPTNAKFKELLNSL